MATIPVQVGAGFGPGGLIIGGLVTAGIILLASNSRGGSGEWRRHTNTAPSRKEARDRAQRNGHGHPPIDHGDHFHSSDSHGNKIPGSHYKWGGRK